MLILSLMLLILMVIIGLGLLSQASAQYRAAETAGPSLQALGIAQAGFEEARVKLQKDPDFPLPGDPSQRTFSYRERFFDTNGTTELGAYTVTIDTSHNQSPWFITKIISVGEAVDASSGQVVARRSLYAEMRTSPYDGSRYGEIVQYRDEGAL